MKYNFELLIVFMYYLTHKSGEHRTLGPTSMWYGFWTSTCWV